MLSVIPVIQVRVPVMDVRKMRMRMGQRFMPMRMSMRLFAIPRKIVLVSMMRIMAMFMGMFHRLMDMLMFMLFGQMQPHSRAHQQTGQPETDARQFAENCQ